MGIETEAILNTADEVDRQILRILKMDGRASIRDIAKQLGVSPATVPARSRNLKKTTSSRRTSASSRTTSWARAPGRSSW